MTVEGQNLGKRFRQRWIFRSLSFSLKVGHPVAIKGRNGSGKSTLLRIIGGILDPNEGQLLVDGHSAYPLLDGYATRIGYCAPYIELIEEFSLVELLRFHSQFKKPRYSTEDMMRRMDLIEHANNRIIDFSSGMKQRVRLSLALHFFSDMYLIDEPGTNLDAKGIDWYIWEMRQLVSRHVVCIASNDNQDFHFCSEQIALSN